MNMYWSLRWEQMSAQVPTASNVLNWLWVAVC